MHINKEHYSRPSIGSFFEVWTLEIFPLRVWLYLFDSLGHSCGGPLSAQADGQWVSDCVSCQRVLQAADLEKPTMVQEIRQLHEKVAFALETAVKKAEGKLKELKKKSGWIPVGVPALQPDPDDSIPTDAIVVKQEVKEEQIEEEDGDRGQDVPEEMMSKAQLITLHGLEVKPKGYDGKVHPIWCGICSRAFEGRNRAKVWQHCSGREHRAKRVKQEFHAAPCYQDQALNDNTESFQHGQCKGLRLCGSFGKLTRLGSDLLPVWKEYATYADLSGSGPTLSGDVRHSYQHHVSEDDWTIRSSKCIRTGLAHKDKLGDAICKSCHEIGNSQKFIWKICALVLDLDIARLLHTRMYRDEHTEAFIAELKKKEIYMFRCGKSYDSAFNSSLQELHKQVVRSWSGRPRNTEAMKMFHMLTIKPCVDVEPTASIKDIQLQQALKFLQGDPNSTSKDLLFMKQMITGKITRHPGLHGLVVAIATKIDNMERGKTTFRDPKRILSTWGYGHEGSEGVFTFKILFWNLGKPKEYHVRP